MKMEKIYKDSDYKNNNFFKNNLKRKERKLRSKTPCKNKYQQNKCLSIIFLNHIFGNLDREDIHYNSESQSGSISI